MSQEKMNSGITAFRNGNKKVALQIFSEIVKSEPRNEAAWLWLAAGVDDIEQKKFCFKKVLEINPLNENAQKALSQIKPSVPSFEDLVNVSSGLNLTQPESVISDNRVKIQALKCPMCGGNIGLNERECSYCGSTLIVTSLEKTLSHKSDTQLLSTSADKWKSILRTDPNNPEANYALGLIYLNQKLRDVALQYLQKASLLMPDSAIVHYNLALTLFNDGSIKLDSLDYENVMKEIDYAIRLNPDFKEAQGFKHFFIARKLEYVDYTESAKEYQSAVNACSDISIFHNNLGFAYFNKKKYDLAEKCYIKSIEINSEFIMAYSNICQLYYVVGRYKEGINYGRKGVAFLRPTTLDDTQAFLYNNLSMCLWKTEQTKEAIEMIKKAIAINPQEPNFQNNLNTYKNTYKGVNVRFVLVPVLLVLLFFFLCLIWIVTY